MRRELSRKNEREDEQNHEHGAGVEHWAKKEEQTVEQAAE